MISYGTKIYHAAWPVFYHIEYPLQYNCTLHSKQVLSAATNEGIKTGIHTINHV